LTHLQRLTRYISVRECPADTSRKDTLGDASPDAAGGPARGGALTPAVDGVTIALGGWLGSGWTISIGVSRR
jgi:hypothetical protein